MSDLDKQLDEALVPLHEYPGGNAAACDYYIDKDMCDCEVANTKSAIKQLIVENLTAYHKAVVEEATHYQRTCYNCDGIWFGLHCPHDGVQNPCPDCGVKPEVLREDCWCDLVITESALNTIAKQFGLQQHSDEQESQ